AWHETTTSGTECTRRHASGTAEQCAQHGSQGVEGGFTEEGSTAQAGQRKETRRKTPRFLRVRPTCHGPTTIPFSVVSCQLYYYPILRTTISSLGSALRRS